MATLTTSYQLIASKYIGAANSSTNKNVYLRIYAKYTSQSVADNKSNVSYKSTLYVEGGGTYFYTGNTTTKSLSGTGATATSSDAQGNYYLGETALCEISGSVAHGSNGSASVSVTAGWNSTPWGISGSLTGTATLPTIARATTPTLSSTSVTMGSNMTITITPADNSFKHKLRYSFGSLSSQVAGLSEGNDFTPAGKRTVTFTPPTSLGSQIPSATSGSCTMYCYTYTSSGTHIGTTSVNITLSVPNYTPTAIVAITGNNLLGGMYVNGKSTVTAKVTASTSYGATIKSYSSTVGGKTYSGSTFTSNALATGNGQYVSSIVTDSRGKTVTVKSATFAVYAYSAPYITTLYAVRQSDGTTVVVTLKGGVSSVNGKNTKSFSVTLNGVTNAISSDGYTVDGTTTFTNVSKDNTFDVVATIKDYYTSATKTTVLPTEAVTLDFHHSGKGIAMGKVAEKENTLDVAWPIMSAGTFNRNSWGSSNKGALTQVVDDSGSQHAAVVGVNSNDERIYSIEFADSTTNPNIRIYAGNNYLRFGASGLIYNEYYVQYLVPLWSGTLSTSGSTATLNQSIANFKYLEIYFHDNDGYYDSTRIRIANGTAISANVGHTAIGSSGYLKQMAVRFNTTTLTVNSNKQIAISTTTGTGTANNGVITDGQFITIDAIVGIK